MLTRKSLLFFMMGLFQYKQKQVQINKTVCNYDTTCTSYTSTHKILFTLIEIS